MSFWCLQFPPKNQWKQVDLKFHSSKVEFDSSFFGGNVDLYKSFWLCLTFTMYRNLNFLPKKIWKHKQFFLKKFKRKIAKNFNTVLNSWLPNQPQNSKSTRLLWVFIVLVIYNFGSREDLFAKKNHKNFIYSACMKLYGKIVHQGIQDLMHSTSEVKMA